MTCAQVSLQGPIRYSFGPLAANESAPSNRQSTRRIGADALGSRFTAVHRPRHTKAHGGERRLSCRRALSEHPVREAARLRTVREHLGAIGTRPGVVLLDDVIWPERPRLDRQRV